MSISSVTTVTCDACGKTSIVGDEFIPVDDWIRLADGINKNSADPDICSWECVVRYATDRLAGVEADERTISALFIPAAGLKK